MTKDAVINIGDRVSLRGQYEVVYQAAYAGSEGWVRDTKVDDDGFEMVYVEWDKNHWRYAGEIDIWTFASHFRVIPEPAPLPSAKEPEQAQPVGDEHEVGYPEIDPPESEHPLCPDCGHHHPEADDARWRDYFTALNEGAEKAADADNFILITIAPTDMDPNLVLPHVYVKCMEPAIMKHLVAQMAAIVSHSTKRYAESAQQETQHGRQAPDVPEDDQAQPPESELP